MYETTMKGSIIINYQPSEEYHLVNKKYVDDIINNIDFSKLETTIDKNVFFDYPGDFYKSEPSGDYMLRKSKGLTDGHIVFNVSSRGIASSSSAKIPPELWGDDIGGSIIDKGTLPNTPEGLGIKDAITTDGKGITNKGFETTDVLTNPNSVITPKKERVFYDPKVEYDIGDIVLFKNVDEINTTDFRELNRDAISKTDYPKAFEVIGDAYGLTLSKVNGTPHKYSELRNNALNAIEGYELVDHPILSNLGGFATAVTKNKLLIIGGFNGDRRTANGNKVYSVDIVDGVLDKFTRIADLPESRIFSKAVLFNNSIYLFGGVKQGLDKEVGITTLMSPLDGDGLPTVWKEVGLPLNNEFSSPVVYLLGNRVYLLGGKVHNAIQDDISTMYHNNAYAWCIVNRDGDLGQWFYGEGEKYGMGFCDVGFAAGGLATFGTADKDLGVVFNYNLFDNITNRVNVTAFNPYTIRKPFSNSEWNFLEATSRAMVTTRGIGTLTGGQGYLSFTNYVFTKNMPGWKSSFIIERTYQNAIGGNARDVYAFEDVGERHYHDAFYTSKKIYCIGGLAGDHTKNYDRGVGSVKTLVIDQGKGGDDNTSHYLPVKDTGSTFRLPAIDPIMVPEGIFTYAIKVR